MTASLIVTIGLDVFEHIHVPNLYKAIKEATRVTSKAIVIDVPIEKDDLHPDQSHSTDKSHVSVYTAEWWIRHFNKTGFKAVQKQVYKYPEGASGATIYFMKPQQKQIG